MRIGTGRRLAAAIAVATLTACTTTEPPPSRATLAPQPGQTAAVTPLEPVNPLAPARQGSLKIALLAPLSGEYADAGRELSNGAAMALFATPGTPAEIIAFDSSGDAGGARLALAAAADAEADVVVGPLFGRNAAAIAADLEAKGLTALSFSNDGSAAGPRVAIMGRSVRPEAARVLRHAAENGARVVAVFGKSDAVGAAAATQAERESASGLIRARAALYPSDASYTDIARNVQALIEGGGQDAARAGSAARLNGQLDAAEDPAAALDGLAAAAAGREAAVYQDLATFYRQLNVGGVDRSGATAAVVSRYASEGGLGGGRPDVVLLTISGAELSTVAPMFQLYDAEAAGVRLLGLSGWSEMDPGRARELHGGRFPLEPYADRFDFDYEAAFGQPPSGLAAVAYDAVRLAIAAHTQSRIRPTPPEALAAAGTIDGARGPVRMSAAGIALRPLEILEMQPTGMAIVDPARIVDPATPTETPTLGAGF